MMLSCKNLSENASDYIEGTTPLGRRLSLIVHLLMCKHCRRFLRQLGIASSTVATVGREEVPSDAEIDTLLVRLRDAQ